MYRAPDRDYYADEAELQAEEFWRHARTQGPSRCCVPLDVEPLRSSVHASAPARDELTIIESQCWGQVAERDWDRLMECGE